MTNIITKVCGFLKKETNDYSHTIHIANNAKNIENIDIARMINYTNDMVTTIHEIIKKPKRISSEEIQLYPNKISKQLINMNKIKIIENNNNLEDYQDIIYEAYKELQQKYLEGLINYTELQSYYEKHSLIINYFTIQDNDSESIVNEEKSLLIAGIEEEILALPGRINNEVEEGRRILAGIEEGEGSSMTGVEYQKRLTEDQARQQQLIAEQQKLHEKQQKQFHEVNSQIEEIINRNTRQNIRDREQTNII